MQRNMTVDAMRCFGLLLIILAHVSPPDTLFQIRTFDVPMMVFISGMSYFLSQKKSVNVINYTISRFKRLVLPVWSFFTLFFIFIYIFRPSGFSELLSLKMIVSTFMLNGFGYVWIIRVFLIIAILSPLYVFFTSKMNGYSVSVMAFVMVLVSTIASMVDYYSQGKLIGHFIYDVIFPAVSYGAVFIVGYKFLTFSKIEKTFLFLLFLITVSAYFAHNYIVLNEVKGFQEYKYPPTMYYISFSFVMIMIVNYFFDFFLKTRKLPKLILDVSSNTIWIYLWHIPVVEFFHRNNLAVDFTLKYTLAVILSISIALVQVFLIRKLAPNSKLMNVIFTG